MPRTSKKPKRTRAKAQQKGQRRKQKNRAPKVKGKVSVQQTLDVLQLPGISPRVQESLDKLTDQQKRFVLAYVGRARGNGVLAAELAGIDGTYSARASVAAVWRHTPDIRAAIHAWMEAYALSAVELTHQIADIAEANMGPFVEWQAKDGVLCLKVSSREDWEAHKHWIKEIQTDPESGRVTKLVLHDSMQARRDMARILKLTSDTPNLAFNFWLSQLSDEQLLGELNRARAEEQAAERLVSAEQRGLPAGEPIAVVPAPGAMEPEAPEGEA